MINCFETYFDAYFAYFAAEPHQFENFVFVIMSTRDNTRLIARASLPILIHSCELFHLFLVKLKFKARFKIGSV